MKHLLNDLRPLLLEERVADVLDTMEELKFSHLPIVDEERIYLGVIAEDDLLEVENEQDTLHHHQQKVEGYSVNEAAHGFDAIKIMGEGNLTLLPVVDDDNRYRGYISASELLQDIGGGLTFASPGGMLVLKLDARDFHLSQIAQIVESEDARILGFHTVADENPSLVLLCLKIDQMDLSRVLKSFERYNYSVAAVFHQSVLGDSYEERFDALLKYLNT